MPPSDRIGPFRTVASAPSMVLAALLSVLAGGCYADATSCEQDADCFRGEVCRTPSSNTGGTCVPVQQPPDDTTSPDDTDPDTSADDTRPETRPTEPDAAPPDTTDCTPTDETCNGRDDDCDGRVDEDLTRLCDNQTDVCEGATVACRDGQFPECGPEQYRAHAETEGTNYEEVESEYYEDGRDNDCNGYTDEVFIDFDVGDRRDYPTCGIRKSDSTALCWGEEDHPVVRQTPDDALRDLAVGRNFACGIKHGGDITCWGEPEHDAGDPPDKSSFIVIDAWNSRSCARTRTGEIYCWGATAPSTENGLDNRYAEFAVDQYDCGIDASTEEIECWNNPSGLVAPFRGSYRDVSLYYVTAGRGTRICGVTTEGELRCRVEQPSETPSLDIPSDTNYTTVSVSKDSACALTDENDDLECWNHRDNFDWPDRTGPFDAVDLAETTLCVLDPDGRLRCYNAKRQMAWRPQP